MRDFLLDTQTVHYWYDPDHPKHSAVVANVELIKQQSASLDLKPRLLVSIITLGEIEFGHRIQAGDWSVAHAAKLKFVREQLPGRLEVTEDAVAAYGEIRALLFQKFAPAKMRHGQKRPEQLVDPATSLSLTIQENDLWLCAQAIGHGMILITNDAMTAIRDVTCNMVPELHIQNWAEAATAKLE